jgi:hypothetical protein
VFINRISNSKSSTIDECLWKYNLKYNLKIPGFKTKSEESLRFGSFIHKVFELGYKEAHDNHWISQTRELIIVLSIKIDTAEKIFYIDMGILFKKIHPNCPLENIRIDHYHIVQTLYNILWKMGEPDEYLDRLFSYDPDDYSQFELKNIPVLMDLYKNKVIPYLQKLDGLVFSAKSFPEVKTWKPFLEFLQPNEYNDMFCREQLTRTFR